MVPPLGAHMSIAGGVDKAPAHGAAVRATALQIFVKNNNRWTGPPISEAQAENFARELKAAGIALQHVFAHTSYLINLASPKADVVEKSRAALVDELERCGQLGLPGLVMHPGSHLGAGRETGIAQVAELAAEAIAATPNVKTRILFETTAGTGNNLGGPFEDIAEILRQTGNGTRTGVCLDTCHIFAAGYDIRDAASYRETMETFDRVIGLKRLKAVHLNDSKHGLGSRKDRHEHIGRGEIGEEAFRQVMTDPRLAKVPMSLETDKGDDLAEDRENLARLYRLAGEEYPG